MWWSRGGHRGYLKMFHGTHLGNQIRFGKGKTVLEDLEDEETENGNR